MTRIKEKRTRINPWTRVVLKDTFSYKVTS